jgi:hypothetical protein
VLPLLCRNGGDICTLMYARARHCKLVRTDETDRVVAAATVQASSTL